jgi:hypothetical protein
MATVDPDGMGVKIAVNPGILQQVKRGGWMS